MTADLDTTAFLGRDRDGDAAPSAEPTPDVQQQAPPPAAEQPVADPSQQTQTDRKEPVRVPLSEVLAERKQRQEYQQRAAYLEGQLQALQAQRQQQEPPRQQATQPDAWTDPAAAIEHRAQLAEQQAEARLVEIERKFLDRQLWASENNAVRTHGKELVEKAKAAVLEAKLVSHFRDQADPYDAVVDWYKRVEAINAVGPDLGAFKKKVREEVLAELNKGSTAAPKFPGTLADATAAGPQGTAPKTEEQMMSGIFGSNRKR